jgi:uncharacterized damage-inducible protein DinB
MTTMQVSNLLTLYNYNYWANARILEAAAKVSQAEFTAPAGVSHGGLRGTLVHTLMAEWIWRTRTQERVSPTFFLFEEDFPTLADLQTRWQVEEAAMRSFLYSLDNEDLTQTIHYASTKGKPLENKLWEILMHLVNHGTQTRSEAAIILTGYGHSPGDLDFIYYLRQL